MFDRPKTGERALLVHLNLSTTADLPEFKELAVSAGAEVLGVITSSRIYADPKYFIGTGKVSELVDAISAYKADLILFNSELSPSQQRNLEKTLSCKVLDRTSLILDIFAQRARTFEGKLQVELAQLQHIATRLVRGWTHLERQKGGIGLRGPGEKQLEVDRRLIRERIKYIKQRLEKIRKRRQQNRQYRSKAQIPTVSIVGYTNAGKSTLFNALTDNSVLTADKLFATLDPTLGMIKLRYIGKTMLTDTVGFIRNLPHSLVDAFKATLEETKNADLLLHVIDCHDELWRDRKEQVEKILHEIGAEDVPILEVYNKIDLLENIHAGFEYDHTNVIARVRVSAEKLSGLDDLIWAIDQRLARDIVDGQLQLTAEDARARAALYDIGAVDSETVDSSGNWLLNVSLQRQKWQTIQRKFDRLPGLS